ncbi:hypothetical protein JRO89_XS01G0377400 [Xanthoceras sorbifolium]|uniref:Uncharacterized protein n=1 Tax=Xanthoceras sorbifolium TaxID=99658 RepID=A0ABQ8INX3_9ROSI|nr:hypothetical protein JRO89_XS01G0377400 [Xanthoceras sorbifolium]
MGVHGLWYLLSPIGRRVSVETLAGKKLAIAGFRLRWRYPGAEAADCHRSAEQRENAQAKIRKTAEKLLINQLKTMRLKELAKDLENQRKQQKKGKMVPSKLALAAASIATEEDKSLSKNASTFAAAIPSHMVDGDEDEEMILPTMDGNVDPAVFAALPPSIQHELLKNDAKGKKILSNDPDQANIMSGDAAESNYVVPKSYDHIKLDEMLAASIAAEEDGSSINNASTSAASIPFEEEDIEEDEEMILPAMDGIVDPAVLSALPPSMQLDLLVKQHEWRKLSATAGTERNDYDMAAKGISLVMS